MLNKSPKDHLIVALDTSSGTEAIKCVIQLDQYVDCFKVGLELITSVGPSIVKTIKDLNKKVFFDGKFLDIPSTINRALTNLVHQHVDMLTIHMSGGIKMMREAKESIIATAREFNIEPPRILGITVLTSIGHDEFENKTEERKDNKIEEHVLDMSRLAIEAKIDGMVCSPREAAIIRKATNKDFLIVTPGIRPVWADIDDHDHLRIATPKEALCRGANYIVIGRPITQAENPVRETIKILHEIEEAMSLGLAL